MKEDQPSKKVPNKRKKEKKKVKGTVIMCSKCDEINPSYSSVCELSRHRGFGRTCVLTGTINKRDRD